jgi:Ca2+-binding EF-hand superfamily protein
VPQCNLSPLCRYGCLVGDVDESGHIDIKDVAGLLLCFGIEAADDNYAECLSIFDYDEDGYIDLTDYEILADLLLNGTP